MQAFTENGNNYSKVVEKLLRQTTVSTDCGGKYKICIC